MKNSARGDSSTGSELKAVEEACREASRTVEPGELCASTVNPVFYFGCRVTAGEYRKYYDSVYAQAWGATRQSAKSGPQ